MSEYDVKISPERGSGELSLVLVGRDLGRNEVRKKRPFIGRAGSLLDNALKEAGIQRSQLLAVTNVVMRRPPNNDFNRHRSWALDEGRSELRDLIERLDPNCVVALGNEAAYALIPDWPTKGRDIFGAKGATDRRGYIYEGRYGGKVIATVHPSFCLRSWVPFRMLLTEDLKKAKKEAEFAEFDWPEREIEVVS